jgi:XTP/dITP diphosphohydrolase
MLEFFDGTVDGEITTRERGENGFGYDRLFLIPALNKTMAELNMEEKNKYSHRALAVLRAIPRLKELIENNAAS